jgi:predicted ATPase
VAKQVDEADGLVLAPAVPVVLTGAPGAGKTAVLQALAARGYATVSESARTIIRDRKRRGLNPRPEPFEFAQEIFHADAAKYEEARRTSGLIFFDRSAVDALGMLSELGSVPQLASCLETYRYHQDVFVFPPWAAIYRTDGERDQTFEEAVQVHQRICDWYRGCQYRLVDVPLAPVAERCDYMVAHMIKVTTGGHDVRIGDA